MKYFGLGLRLNSSLHQIPHLSPCAALFIHVFGFANGNWTTYINLSPCVNNAIFCPNKTTPSVWACNVWFNPISSKICSKHVGAQFFKTLFLVFSWSASRNASDCLRLQILRIRVHLSHLPFDRDSVQLGLVRESRFPFLHRLIFFSFLFSLAAFTYIKAALM